MRGCCLQSEVRAPAALGELRLRSRPISLFEEQKLGQEALDARVARLSQGSWPSWQGASLGISHTEGPGAWGPAPSLTTQKMGVIICGSPFSELGQAILGGWRGHKARDTKTVSPPQALLLPCFPREGWCLDTVAFSAARPSPSLPATLTRGPGHSHI